MSTDTAAPVPTPAATDSSFSVRDRAVVVTGASAGIGREIAAGLMSAGARVVIAGRRRDLLDEVAAQPGEAHVVECDLRDEDDRARLIATAIERVGPLHGLVNNAGISGSGVPAARESVAQLRDVLEVDLVAPFDLAARCLPSLREAGGGSIVNITSIAGIRSLGTYIPQAAYCAAKAGLGHLTRELATQWGRYGIRVNAIAPGFFPTDMTTGNRDENGLLAWFGSRVPIKRGGDAQDIRSLVQFLLSDASSFISGQEIALDGGYSVT
jgi:NAD(P)-dependent dehydrogenase (short-subunit alcohol dehydrogenase family)